MAPTLPLDLGQATQDTRQLPVHVGLGCCRNEEPGKLFTYEVLKDTFARQSMGEGWGLGSAQKTHTLCVFIQSTYVCTDLHV